MLPFPNICLCKRTVRSLRASNLYRLLPIAMSIKWLLTSSEGWSPLHILQFLNNTSFSQSLLVPPFQLPVLICCCFVSDSTLSSLELHPLISSITNDKRKWNKFPLMRKFSPGTEDLGKCIKWLEECWQHCNYQDSLLASAQPSLPLDWLSSDPPV